LGVGINVQPSAVLIARNLGLLQALEHTGIETEELNFYDRHDDSILREKRGTHAGYSVPQFSIHRGDLPTLLLSSVKKRLGGGSGASEPRSDRVLRTFKPSFSQRRDGALAELSAVLSYVLIADDLINGPQNSIYEGKTTST
jgi:hypothetical protein